MPVWWPGSQEQLALSLWPSNGIVWWNVSLGRAWPGCASLPELGPGRWRRWPVVWVSPHSTLGSGSGLPLSAQTAPRPCCLVFHSRSSPEAGKPTSPQAPNMRQVELPWSDGCGPSLLGVFAKLLLGASCGQRVCEMQSCSKRCLCFVAES